MIFDADVPLDAVIIGGGFYGAIIATYLVRQRGLRRILLVEQESQLLTRASYNNQARVHNGYHYPRSFTTAYRSRVNLAQFVQDWPDAISRNFTKLYAIARRNSKVTAKQFRRFCQEIGASLQPVDPALRTLFNTHLIEDIFLVQEYAFDASQLARWAIEALRDCRVQIAYETTVTDIFKGLEKPLRIVMTNQQGERQQVSCRYVFNCTYSGLNQFGGDFPGTRTRLKQEITEMALVNVPPALAGLGITVMDGPFFSIMPFPARNLYTLSHVRYTPHLHWDDRAGLNPYQKLKEYDCVTRVDRMIRDASRFVPAILQVQPVDSLFEVKTILVKNEGDDGRPILLEKHVELPGCFSVLGGKIDNIYDVLEKLEVEQFDVGED